MQDPHEYGTVFMNFREALATLLKMEDEDLERSAELGSKLDFRFASRIVGQVFQLYRPLQGLLIDHAVPMNRLAELDDFVKHMTSMMQRILSFDPGISGIEERESIVNELEDAYTNQFERVVALGLFCNQSREAPGPSEAAEALRVMKEIASIRKKIDAEHTEALEIVSGMRKAAAEAGTVEHAQYFREEAEKHRSAKERWLWATSGLTALVLLAASAMVWYYATGAPDWTVPQIVQIALAKVILFSGLSYAVVLSARSYRAESHNEVVNRHRENALKTFEAFAAASENSETQSAVLLQATQCIFSHQGTGFSQPDHDQGPSKVLEVIQRMVPRPGGAPGQ